ncbi:MAG: GNAT family N-acetyltransferase [Candidatus Omnitrophica bacterium]|nr:GNAT family N-acetyltransferase [Candidatus Omnitrophota bacterium]
MENYRDRIANGRIAIRQYKKEDRGYVRDIAYQTAFLGEPASVFFDDKEILADFLTLYFTDYEPESCFVAENNARVVGYLIGARDANLLKNIFQFKIAPSLLFKTVIKGTLIKKKNLIFFFNSLVSFLRGEFLVPDFYKIYPALLHINIKKDFRNKGIGSELIRTYLRYLLNKKISGVHLATISDTAGIFFIKQGFNLLYKNRRTHFRYILNKDIQIYAYGKRLLKH